MTAKCAFGGQGSLSIYRVPHLPIGRWVFGDYRLTSRLTVDTAVAANIPSIWDLPDDRPRLALDIEPQAKYGALLLQVPPSRRIQIERAEVV